LAITAIAELLVKIVWKFAGSIKRNYR